MENAEARAVANCRIVPAPDARGEWIGVAAYTNPFSGKPGENRRQVKVHASPPEGAHVIEKTPSASVQENLERLRADSHLIEA